MAPEEREKWAIGDRVVWPHKEGIGKSRHTVRSPGTVTGMDLPGLPRGVRVQFDHPVNGVDHCYATHDELARESRQDEIERRGGAYLCSEVRNEVTGEVATVEELLDDDMVLLRYSDGSTEIRSSEGLWV